MPRDTYYDAAVAFVEQYGWHHSRLPHFSPRGPLSKACPIARAVPGSRVGTNTFTYGNKTVPLPKEVVIFVERADTGKFYADLLGLPR